MTAPRIAGPQPRGPLLDWVHRTLREDRALSPRTAGELARAYDEGRLLVIERHGVPAGWVLRIPHGPSVQEIAGAYARPESRGGIVEVVLREVLDAAPVTFCATGEPGLARHLSTVWGFRRCSPGRLIRLTGGRVLADRLRPGRLRYARGYLRSAPPRLLYRDRRWPVCPACRVAGPASVLNARDIAFGSGVPAVYRRCTSCGHLARTGEMDLPEPNLPFVESVMDHPVVRDLVYAPRLRWLSRHVAITGRTRLLDVGCGTGGFLDLVSRRHGARCTGVELDSTLAASASRRGLDVTAGDFGHLPPREFDIVTMFQVLEHLPDPRAALRHAFGLLRPGGVLCVEIPIADCVARRLFGRYWFPLLPPYHRHICSRRSLAALAPPEAREVAAGPVYLPGEYLVSATLPVAALLPHPHQRHRPSPTAQTAGGVLAVCAAAAVLPLEVLSGVAHRVLPMAGHWRVLWRKEVL
ncbi:class I SAM-dependent methyltransferase [Actinoplanes sp. NPDC051861]|uniref:class I SAM-dependent methyltransferase n=1 Tax=Actinoplanes sp. NPDC051861 TaxID=3155170 RepID=UPI0034149791